MWFNLFSAAVVLVCTAWIAAGLLAVLRVVARRPRGGGELGPVSVLKPLCGRDGELRENLESFFRQDHPDFELIFGAVDAADPALEVVAELRERYPNVACRVCVHAGGAALNPKVDNLMGMLPHARHDLVLVSDSNVRAPRHTVSELARIHRDTRAGIVTNLFAGQGENGIGSALESTELNGFCAAGAALPTLLGDPLVIGKSTLFSRAVFERLGGLPRLSAVLAEDFVLGKMFHNVGLSIEIAPTVLHNQNRDLSLRGAFARRLRWTMLRWRLRPLAAALEPLTSPLVTLPFAWHLFGPTALVWMAALFVVRDAGGWLALRGKGRIWLPLCLSPLRECLWLAAWGLSSLKRHVTWRGTRLRISAGTLLFLEEQPEAR
jgi:ceramide glucosyltransferase